MTKTNFSLDVQAQGEALRCPDPAQVIVPLSGHSTKTVKKKAEVAPGTLVAEHPGKNTGDAHSPIAGVVADISASGVTITAQDVEAKAEPVNTKNLSDDDLKATLKSLGISTAAFTKAQNLIVNGLNPEPGVAIASYLLAQEVPLLNKGLEAVKRISCASSCHLVIAQNTQVSLDGCAVAQIEPVYPNSLDALVIKAALWKENPDDVLCVDVHTLYLIGKALDTGLPATETLVSVEGKIVAAKVGQPISEVLAAAGTTVQDHDAVILGGPLRGESIPSLTAGLPKEAFALTVVRVGEFPPVSDQPCVNCGECVAHCPARIRPNMIARYAEFKKYADTQGYGIDHCMECGLCGFWCTARRPMLQYIRLAKQELAAQAADLASCALNE